MNSGSMKRPLTVAAVLEVATGVALLTVPSWVGRLLLGEELTGMAVTLARLTGIALIALGVTCWPGTPLAGMLTYNAAVALYLAFIGYTSAAGPLLWPAVAVHAVLTVLLAREATARK